MWWVRARGLVLAVALVAALPVVVSTIRALAVGWTPVFDDAIIATNAFDVLSARSHLVGVYSDASLPAGEPVYNAGPLLFWLLALQARFLGDWALVVTAGLVNVASIMGAVALAHRRGGLPCTFLTAVAVDVMLASLPSEVRHDILNPSIALLPLTLLFFLAWSVGCGEYRLLPVTVVVASFVAQTHLTSAVAGAAAIGVGLAGLAVWATRTRDAREGAARRDVRRRLLIGGAVALVCWSAPLVDQATNRPGNIARAVQIARADERTTGKRNGLHGLVRTVGVPPWWLRGPRSNPERFADVVATPGIGSIVSCVLVLGGVALAGLVGLRRRRTGVVVAAALALALAAAVALAIAVTPHRLIFSLEKVARLASPVGMFVWLVPAWALVKLAPGPSWRWGARSSLALAALGATALVAVTVATRQQPDNWEETYRPVDALAARIGDQLPRDRTVYVVPAGSFRTFAVQTALVYRLRREGFRVVTGSNAGLALVSKLGRDYAPERHPPDDVLLVDDLEQPARFRGSRVLARARITRDPGSGSAQASRARPITVTIFPAHELPHRGSILG
jgi:hypothetical protein